MGHYAAFVGLELGAELTFPHNPSSEPPGHIRLLKTRALPPNDTSLGPNSSICCLLALPRQ